MIELIIFDLDGTLIDSAQDITNSINSAIAGTSLPLLETEQTIKLIGGGISELFEKLLPAELKSMQSEIIKRFIDYYSLHLIDNTRPYPYVKETLEKLHRRKKAIVSNKRESLSKEILDKLDLIEYFDIILGSDSAAEKKPSPRPIDIILERLSVSRNASVMVGDSDIDIQTAQAARIRSIAVTYGYRPRESLKDADYMIDNFRELEYAVDILL